MKKVKIIDKKNMTLDIPPEIYKYIENKEVPPYELFELMFNKMIEAIAKLKRPNGGRKKKYFTPEEATVAHRQKALESYYRRKARQQMMIQPVTTLLVTT